MRLFLLLVALCALSSAAQANEAEPPRLVVLISIGVPVRMAWGALMALLNRAPEERVVDEVRAAVEAALAGLEYRAIAVRVIHPGRTRYVLAHVLLAAHEQPALDALDAARERATVAARKSFEVTEVDLLFTRDERWFAALPARV